MIYRFRATYEDHEDVFRDIEIKATHSFTDFHTSIQESIGFDNSKSACFYLSDDYWRKEEEIAAINTGEDNKKSKSKGTSTFSGKRTAPKKKLIVDFVNDPHQKFIYVFDPDKEWTFQLELLKILPEENGVAYPRCIKVSGTSPKQYKETTLPPPLPEEEEIKSDKEELLPEDDIKAAIGDEDMATPSLGAEEIISLIEEEEEGSKPDEEESDSEEDEGESSDEFNLKDDEDL